MKRLLALACAIVTTIAVAATFNWNQFDEPIPTPKTVVQGNIPANSRLCTNVTDVIQGVAKNLKNEITERKGMISTENTNLVKVIRDVILNGDYIWDATTKILYQRKVDNNRLYYIAVTNVNLLATGQLLKSEMPQEEK